MSLLDEVLTEAKRHHVSITYAAQMAGYIGETFTMPSCTGGLT